MIIPAYLLRPVASKENIVVCKENCYSFTGHVVLVEPVGGSSGVI